MSPQKRHSPTCDMAANQKTLAVQGIVFITIATSCRSAKFQVYDLATGPGVESS